MVTVSFSSLNIWFEQALVGKIIRIPRYEPVCTTAIINIKYYIFCSI